MLRKYAVIILTAAGLTLLALAKRLAGDDRPGPLPNAGGQAGSRRHPPGAAPGHTLIDLPRHQYRHVGAPPGRWEVYRLGLAILFGSLKFAVMGV